LEVGIELRASHMLHKHSTTKPPPSLNCLELKYKRALLVFFFLNVVLHFKDTIKINSKKHWKKNVVLRNTFSMFGCEKIKTYSIRKELME
jgi:hypothetical protein